MLAEERGDRAADKLAGAGVGKAAGKGKNAHVCKHHAAHAHGDVSLFRLENAEGDHQQRADDREHAGVQLFLDYLAVSADGGDLYELEAGDDEAEDDAEEHKVAHDFLHGAELCGGAAGADGLHLARFNDGLVGGKLRRDEYRVEYDDDDAGQAGKADIPDLELVRARAEILQKAVILRGVYRARADGQRSDSGNGDDADGEHDLRRAYFHLVAHAEQQREHDAERGHRAGNYLRDEERDDNVTRENAVERALGRLGHAAGELCHHLRLGEARGDDEHAGHYDGVGVGEAGERGLDVDAAGDDQQHHAKQRRERHGDLPPEEACDGQNEDDQTDNHMDVHAFFLPFFSLFAVLHKIQQKRACCMRYFYDNILTYYHRFVSKFV